MEAGTITVDPPSTSNGDDHHDRKKRLSSVASSSSSSSDTSFIDLHVDDAVLHVGSMSVADGKSGEEPSSGPTAPTAGLNISLRNDSLEETPGESTSGYEITPYRLPSSVLSRMKSETRNDWSVNSNESLFSIYVGNTSFNRDFGKDGETVLTSTSSMKEFTNPPPPPLEHPSDQLKSPLPDSSGEAEFVEIQAVLRVNPDHKTTPSVSEGALVCSPSRNSNSSVMSFAFPILTDRQKSFRCDMKNVKTGSVMSDLQHEQQLHSSEDVTAEPQVTPKASRGRSKSKWLSFFCCWSSRSNEV